MEKVSTIAAIVKKLLIKYDSLKDNDKRLILNVWLDQEPTLKDASFVEFTVMFKAGKLCSTESIRRSRQKLQEEFPEFRGKTYKARKGKAQDEVKEDLNTLELLAGGNP
jgi:hypothetical protein